MEIIHTHQIKFDELTNEKLNVLIAACGFESRASYIAQVPYILADRKIVFLFKEYTDLAARKYNETVFKANNFECYDVSASSSDELTDVLRQICHQCNEEQIKILIDYTSMPITWYGTLINYFVFNELAINNLIVYFNYTPENFMPPEFHDLELKNLAPVFFNRTLVNTNKPIALVVGLGFSEKNVQFINSYFNSVNLVLFFPKQWFGENYTKIAKQKNENILNETNDNNIYYYNASHIEEIETKLTSVCLNLRINYRVVVVSLGPKTFSLASFLINARYPDVEIWHANIDEGFRDLKPSGFPLVYKAVMINEEDY
jgi:hypothetical protein